MINSTMIRVLSATATALLITLLLFSERPTERRRIAINAAIEAKLIAAIPKNLNLRFEAQVLWLAKHAGVTSPIRINRRLERGALNILVTTDRTKALTGCGSGNALYDPSLDAIFIDESLVWPFEIAVLGERSPFSMAAVESFGFTAGYLNFILAHELGHRQLHRRAGAFFQYGWQSGGSARPLQEQEADQFSLATIIKAYKANDMPEALKGFDSLDAVGLRNSSALPSDARARADVIGALVTMNKALLFSSSPFSPYFVDNLHPSFIRRTVDAIAASDSASTSLSANLSIIKRLTEAYDELGRWKYAELHFPGPIIDVERRLDAIWLATRDVHTPTEREYSIQERIYRSGVKDILTVEGDSHREHSFRLVATGRSSADGLPGDWAKLLLFRGDLSINLPPGSARSQPTKRVIPSADESVWWDWDDLTTGHAEVSEAKLKSELEKVWSVADTKIGQMQYDGPYVCVPVEYSKQGSRYLRFACLHSHNGQLADIASGEGPCCLLADGFDVDSAIFWRGAWWGLAKPIHSAGNYGWELRRVSNKEMRADVISRGTFRTAVATSVTDGALLRDLDPFSPKMFPLSGDRILFGYTEDSMYLYDVKTDKASVIFHPALKGLKATPLGADFVLFWIENAKKGYLVDTKAQIPTKTVKRL